MKPQQKRLLKLLRSNPKLSYRQLSKLLGVSTSTVTRWTDELESENIIKDYNACLDYNRLGYKIKVLIEIKLASGRLEEIENDLVESPHVSQVFDITGDTDAIAVAYFKNREELSDYVKDLLSDERIERTKTNLVLDTMRSEVRLGPEG